MTTELRNQGKMLLIGGMGSLLVLVTVVIVLRSDLLLTLPRAQALLGKIETIDRTKLVVYMAAVLILYAIWAGRSSTIREPRNTESDVEEDAFAAIQQSPPEAVTAARRSKTNQVLDKRIQWAIQGDPNALSSVRSTFKDVAVTGVMHQEGTDADSAIQLIENGTWTETHLAAAFLASEDAYTFRLSDRLRMWLDPVAERRRRIRRTVQAIRDTYRWGAAE